MKISKGFRVGRGKYGIKVTYKGRRGLGTITFRTKERAERYRNILKKKYPRYKNPRIVKLT